MLGAALTLGLASPVAVAHMASRMRRPRPVVVALVHVGAYLAALVAALGAPTPIVLLAPMAVGLVGIALVVAWLPAYRDARMRSSGHCVCAIRRARTEPHIDARAGDAVLV